MSKKSSESLSPGRRAINELDPPRSALFVGREAGDTPPRDFFTAKNFPRVIGATVVYREDGSEAPMLAYFGGGTRRRPRPTISDAVSMYAMTVGELQTAASEAYPDASAEAFTDARIRWRSERVAHAAKIGSHLIAAHVICEGRAGIADAFVYPWAIGEQAALAARETLVSGLPHLTTQQQAAAQPQLNGGPALQETATLLMASIMPSPGVMELECKRFNLQ